MTIQEYRAALNRVATLLGQISSEVEEWDNLYDMYGEDISPSYADKRFDEITKIVDQVIKEVINPNLEKLP